MTPLVIPSRRTESPRPVTRSSSMSWRGTAAARWTSSCGDCCRHFQLGPVEPSDGAVTIDDLVARGLLQAARRPDRPAPEFSMPLWAGTRIDQLVREVRGR